MENKFKKGLLLGGILGVASIIGYVVKKHGPEITEEIQDELKTISKKVKKKLMEMEDVSKEKFSEMVQQVTEEYGEKKHLPEKIKELVKTMVLEKWTEMEHAYKAEHEDEKE